MRRFSKVTALILLAPLFPWSPLAAMPAVQSGAFDPPLAPDLDPDPDVVEVELTAGVGTWEYLPGVQTTVWSYNGSIPGPTIEANLGDLLRVHFTNELPEATTVHWHGVETPADMDGSHISQLTVPPGGTFEYEFELMRAGMFWFHPHVRTFDQVEKGLYGVLLVRDPELEESLGLDEYDEHVLVFDDVLLDSAGQLVPSFSFSDPLQNALYQLNGRAGNHTLVNGRLAGSGTILDVPNGVPQRWRVLNAANTTFCRLDVNEDLASDLWLIGTDGGFVERPIKRGPVVSGAPPGPQFTGSSGASGLQQVLHPFQSNPNEGIFVVPGERMDVVFTPHGFDGQRLRIYQYDWTRGRHIADYDANGNIILPDDPLDGMMPPVEYLRLDLQGPDPGEPYPAPPQALVDLSEIDALAVNDVLPVTFGHSSPDPAGDVNFFAQADFIPNGSGGTTMVPLPTAKIDSFKAHDVHVGDVWLWEVTNLTHGDHPFHTHGFYFQPLEIELIDDINPILGRKETFYNTMWKDTIRLPARPGLKGSSRTVLRALVHFDDVGREGQVVAQGDLPTLQADGSMSSGGWLFHCHVLEHSGRGMLSYYEVREKSDPFWLVGHGLAGTNGIAGLSASGSLDPGGEVNVQLMGALSNTQVLLVMGLSAINLSIVGGTLVPNLDDLRLSTTTQSGQARWSIPEESFPADSAVYLQAVFLDPAGPFGLGFSNAVQVNVPRDPEE